MITLDLIQGSESWHAHRATARNASEAPVVMGFSKYKKRSELLREKYTGIVPEADAATQARFDDGHESEALARPNVEQKYGVDLYPEVGSTDDGYLSASFDGLTVDEGLFWENKLKNQDLLDYIIENDDLPDSHWPQVEHEYIVSNAKACVFTLCDKAGNIVYSLQYQSRPERRAAVLAAWRQFDEDLANYKLAEVVAETVAAPSLNLPSVSVQVKGEIAIIDNFKVFEVALRDFLDTKLIRKPQTDQDFADLETQVKTLKKAEDALEAAEAAVVSQVAAIDAMKRTKDMLYKMTRENRLMAEKLVASEKDARRAAIIEGGKTSYAMHIQALNTRLGKPYMPVLPADFAGAAKGKKTITSIQDAVDNELARAKIAANEVADRIDANLKQLRENAAEYPFLFMDAQTLVLKASEDVANTITARISEHKAKEEARLNAEREKIRLEEEAKAKAKVEAEEREKMQHREIEKGLAAASELADIGAKVREELKVAQPSLLEAELSRKQANNAKNRPTRAEIVEVIAKHYGVSITTAADWLE